MSEASAHRDNRVLGDTNFPDGLESDERCRRTLQLKHKALKDASAFSQKLLVPQFYCGIMSMIVINLGSDDKYSMEIQSRH